MTQEQKRIKIAEACGLGLKQEEGQRYKSITDMLERSYTTLEDLEIPDYFNDLNAMHEAEKVILKNADTGYAYDCELNIEVGAFEDGVVNYMKLWHATATQRAEAFGRTLGLWT